MTPAKAYLRQIAQTAEQQTAEQQAANKNGAVPAQTQATGAAERERECPRCGGIGFFVLDVPPDHPSFGKAQPCPCQEEARAAMRQKRLANIQSPTNQAFTFDSFEPKDATLMAAYDAAREFAKNPESWLVLSGGNGCGKTHLATAVYWELLAKEIPAMFISAPDIFGGLLEDESRERLDAYQNAPVLIIDDLGTERPSAWVKEKRYQLLNWRYTQKLPTVITTNDSLGTFSEFDGRVLSRLLDKSHKVVRVKSGDYRNGRRNGLGSLSELEAYRQTFDSWTIRGGNDASAKSHALELAQRLAGMGDAPPPTITLIAGREGKSHLAAAIANNVASCGVDGVNVVWLDTAPFLEALNNIFINPVAGGLSYYSIMGELKEYPGLVVFNDWGKERFTTWRENIMRRVIERRRNAKLPVLISVSVPLTDLDGWLMPKLDQIIYLEP